MLEVLSIEKVDKIEWQDLLSRSSTSSYFQSPEYFDFINNLSFLEAFGWSVYKEGKLKALVCGYIVANGGKVKQFFSRRAIIYSGLLLDEKVQIDEIELLLTTLKKSLSKKVIYIEIRNSSDFSKYKENFQKSKFEYHSHLNYLVDTTSLDQIENRYSESKLRQIRKAGDQNVVCESTVHPKDILRFYDILSELYKNKIKKPLFPIEFFEKLVKQENCYLFVVKKDDVVIGGIACASLPGKAVYEWFVCGDAKNFNNLYPSVVATHKGIKYAAENGFAYFDFMGAGKLNSEYGVRDFKEKFGGELVEFGRFILINRHCLYFLGKLYMKI